MSETAAMYLHIGPLMMNKNPIFWNQETKSSPLDMYHTVTFYYFIKCFHCCVAEDGSHMSIVIPTS